MSLVSVRTSVSAKNRENIGLNFPDTLNSVFNLIEFIGKLFLVRNISVRTSAATVKILAISLNSVFGWSYYLNKLAYAVGFINFYNIFYVICKWTTIIENGKAGKTLFDDEELGDLVLVSDVLDLNGATKVKAFLWEDLETLVPVCDCAEEELNITDIN